MNVTIDKLSYYMFGYKEKHRVVAKYLAKICAWNFGSRWLLLVCPLSLTPSTS